MPLFEYRCTSCGHHFEKIEKFNAEPEVACPRCGGDLERPLTAPGLHFKGAGWYVNDYAPRPASGGNVDKISAEAAADAKSSESKPSPESKPSESKSDAESKPASSDSTSKPASTPAPQADN